ncbi:hypothetical protein GQ457_05G011480 [Hibiscus cannabinus]
MACAILDHELVVLLWNIWNCRIVIRSMIICFLHLARHLHPTSLVMLTSVGLSRPRKLLRSRYGSFHPLEGAVAVGVVAHDSDGLVLAGCIYRMRAIDASLVEEGHAVFEAILHALDRGWSRVLF